jgi:DNA-directed RNA polymerase subunit L
MEIKVIESTKHKLVIDIIGEGHSLCNALNKELNENKKVTTAGYFIDHPQTGTPRMVIETSGIKPKDALIDAAKKLQKINESFLTAFTKELK